MKKLFLLAAVILLMAGCSKTKTSGGIVFAFDGQSVKNWIEYRELFDKYKIRASFFVNPGDKADPEMEKELKTLRSDGHEIACHGISNLNPTVINMSAPEFYREEAESQVKILGEMGFKPVSYAYTYALAPDSLDKYMLGKFSYVRKATWNKFNTSIDSYDYIYARPDSFRVVHSMGIDCNSLLTLENIRSGMERARKNDEVLVLHAHKIDGSGINFTINPAFLEDVFKLAKKENLTSIRMQDLEDFFAKRAQRQQK